MRRLKSFPRRTAFALSRAVWDALDLVGDHVRFAALSVVAALTLVFVTRGDGLSVLLGLAGVLLAFLFVVAFMFVQAFAHPDRHSDWEWQDYGVPEDLWRLELRSLAPLRPQASRRRDVKPLLCRVLAPDKSLWESFVPTVTPWTTGDSRLRFYPQDFKCPKCGQPPPQILPGEYEITWSEPWWGPIRRPLLRYTQQTSLPEPAPESGGRAS
jgi:hypothetical protein